MTISEYVHHVVSCALSLLDFFVEVILKVTCDKNAKKLVKMLTLFTFCRKKEEIMTYSIYLVFNY